jgi:hypothetical protein
MKKIEEYSETVQTMSYVHMTEADFIDIKGFLLDLEFMQINSLVAVGLAETKKAQVYLKRLTQLRLTIAAELKEKNT